MPHPLKLTQLSLSSAYVSIILPLRLPGHHCLTELLVETKLLRDIFMHQTHALVEQVSVVLLDSFYFS
jgi:hypothetical protein